jgi:hypothetical protein
VLESGSCCDTTVEAGLEQQVKLRFAAVERGLAGEVQQLGSPADVGITVAQSLGLVVLKFAWSESVWFQTTRSCLSGTILSHTPELGHLNQERVVRARDRALSGRHEFSGYNAFITLNVNSEVRS